MEFRKEIVRPGTYTYMNPNTGLPERLTVTPETIKHYHDQGKAMLESGLSVPVPLEHQPDARPMTAAERAAANLRNMAGDTKRYELGKVEGSEEEALFAVIDVTDGEIAKKIQDKTLKWVSPWIHSFVDGAGRAWDNVVSHIALTGTPRITKQTPFESMGVAMSMVGSLTDKVISDRAKSGFSLSPIGRLKEKGGKLKPAFPLAFSMMTGIPLAKEEFEDVEEDDGDDMEPESTPGEDVPATPAAVVPDLNGDGQSGTPEDMAIHDCLADLLKMANITLPPGTSKENFLQGLYRALMEFVKTKIGEGEKDKTSEELGMIKGEDKAMTQNPVIQESPPMYMSVQEIHAKVKDPTQRKMHEAMLSMFTKLKSVEKNQLDEANRRRTARVEKIAGRLPADKKTALVNLIASPNASLSLLDGAIVDPVADQVTLYEELANALNPYEATTLVEQPNPNQAYSTRVVDELLKNTGGIRK